MAVTAFREIDLPLRKRPKLEIEKVDLEEALDLQTPPRPSLVSSQAESCGERWGRLHVPSAFW